MSLHLSLKLWAPFENKMRDIFFIYTCSSLVIKTQLSIQHNKYWIKRLKKTILKKGMIFVLIHRLELKVGSPIILFGNLDQPWLCNGTRHIIKRLMPYVIEATILTASGKAEDAFILRIPLTPSIIPFRFKRLHFPIRLNFAIFINKSQDQTVSVVGFTLRRRRRRWFFSRKIICRFLQS